MHAFTSQTVACLLQARSLCLSSPFCPLQKCTLHVVARLKPLLSSISAISLEGCGCIVVMFPAHKKQRGDVLVVSTATAVMHV